MAQSEKIINRKWNSNISRRSTSCGLVKETASKIVGSAMPLYFPCPCQLKANAQLMRLHVVTPKLAVDVSVQPRVQPAPSSPVFHPFETITLSQSSYWVVRLPYVYKNKGVVYRPSDGSPCGVESARLLGGTFSVATGRPSWIFMRMFDTRRSLDSEATRKLPAI